MTAFALSGLLAGISAISFGLLVLFKSQNKQLRRIWFLFSLSASVWGLGGFWIGTAKNLTEALWAWRLTFAFGVIWIPTFFFHFICTFCELRRKKSILAHYIISTIFFLSTWNKVFFNSSRLILETLYFPTHGWLFPIFTIWWISFVIHSHYEMWLSYRVANQSKRNQIKYLFLGTAIGYIGGSLTYLPHYGIDLYPWGNFTVFLYPIIMSYAIIQFNLMDIRILVRRTALFVLVYAALLLISTLVLALFHANTPAHPFASFQITETLLISFILSTGPFLYAYVIRRNTYFQEYTLASLTHELKSPLAIIDSALDFLQSNPNIKKVDSAQLSAYLEMIQRNSSRLSLFVNDLLYTFKNQRKDFLISPQPQELRQLFLHVVDSISHWQKKKKSI